ncbi:MAG: hypothetical protein Q8T09_02835 [Candidatus Melainabacteria bacterium]|nr:hypothetical protein [Candidatus Melainabacteria bacterium]
MTIKASVILEGIAQPSFTVDCLDDLETLLASLGYTRNGEWLPDEDFGFTKSTTFTHASGESKIICLERLA